MIILVHGVGVVGEHGRANVDFLGAALALAAASLALVAATAAVVSARI